MMLLLNNVLRRRRVVSGETISKSELVTVRDKRKKPGEGVPERR